MRVPARCGPALLALVTLTVGATGAAARDVPYLASRVNDTAGMIPGDGRERLESRLAAFEQKTGTQVAVLTIDTLDGDVLEDYSMRVVETWKLGRKGKDDGILLLIVKNDRKMRIEVGYGLEGTLTDAQSRRILDGVIRPQFRAGKFGEGVEAGTEAILATLEGKEPAIAEPAAGLDSGFTSLGARLAGLLVFVLVVGVFSLVAVFAPGCGGWFLYLFLTPFYFAFPAALVHPAVGVGLTTMWLIGFPILKLFFSRTKSGKAFVKGNKFWKSLATAAASHSSSGGGWSSGGGFSGGGGSFGGGGASSSW